MSTITYCPGCIPLREYAGEVDYCADHRPETWVMWDEVLKLTDREALQILGFHALQRELQAIGIERDVNIPEWALVPEWVAIKAIEMNYDIRDRERRAREDAAARQYHNPLTPSFLETRFPAWRATFLAYYRAWVTEIERLGYDVIATPGHHYEIGEILARREEAVPVRADEYIKRR